MDGTAVEPQLLERMCEALVHRGPDSRGVHVDGGAGLGVQRLRVIDLVSGDQPIFNEDRSVAVVLNGEIYNYRELRSRLERSGHRFATDGDTEVIAHLYEDEGPDCVRSLTGMFAFAVWDTSRGQLLIARDRVGKKPLYYSLRRGALTFASELGAVLQDPEVEREVDHQALDCYLALRYVPAPFSAFRSVRKLPPATTLVLRDGKPSCQRYWKLDYGSKRDPESDDLVYEEIRDRIREAVRRRLISDVPLGAFLSGGIDSSAVVAAMAERSSQPVRTFSIGFTSDGYDELPLARLVAERFGTDHEELVVEPDALDVLPRIVRHYGEPFGDSSALPSFYVAQMASERVTVALNGDGGDESFAGYPRYVANRLLARLDVLPLELRRRVASLSTGLSEGANATSATNRLRRLGAVLPLAPEDRHLGYVSHLNGLDRERLYTPDYRAVVGPSVLPDVVRGPWRSSSGHSVLDRMLDVDVQTYLPGQLLTKIDIATMAHSLEGRSPLLDHEFMAFAASLPDRFKVRGTETKVGLRRALRGWVPDEVLDAPKKGFRLPIADWFRGPLASYTRDVLLDPGTRQRGLFDEGYVRELLEGHQAGRADNAAGIWSLLMLELWYREFVDPARPPALAETGAVPL
jgi:asparagine synthase (glutamine-hydrolysing)